ncbi:MAG: ABC transporter substrate-binding protein [Myxococcales bacterium]|nr:ABC transporter substrate-binding protein [Myxococcales bacterium]
MYTRAVLRHLYKGLALLLVLGSLACGGKEGAGQGPVTLIVGRVSDAIGLDPARVTDNESVEICGQIYESLLRYRSGTTEVEAGLAVSWEVSEDGRQWDFQLREGVKFHDGTPFDAEAVVFSFQRQLDENHPYHLADSSGLDFGWRSAYQNIVSVEATGRHSLRIAIDRKFAPFAANLAMFPVAIVSPSAVKEWGEEFYRHPVGTGPFAFGEWSGRRIVLERNGDYWGTLPKLGRLIFKAIPDARQRLVALESGAVQVAYSILPEEQQFVTLHPELKLYLAPANNVSYVAMNTQRPPFDNVRLRRAINRAVNREPVVKLAYQGMAIPAAGALPPTQWGYSPKSFDYDFDPERARSEIEDLLIEGGVDPELEIAFYVPSTPRPYLPDPGMVARIIKSNLEAVGLKVRLVEQEFPKHLEALRRGKHDISLMGWVGDNGDPDNYLYVLFDEENTVAGSARNLSFLADAPLHTLLLEAQQISERGARTEIYKRAQERIGSLAPWVPLVHSQIAVVARADVHGIVISPSAQVLFEQVELK